MDHSVNVQIITVYQSNPVYPHLISATKVIKLKKTWNGTTFN